MWTPLKGQFKISGCKIIHNKRAVNMSKTFVWRWYRFSALVSSLALLVPDWWRDVRIDVEVGNPAGSKLFNIVYNEVVPTVSCQVFTDGGGY